MSQTTDAANDTAVTMHEGKKYAPFKHSFRDPWADADVDLCFRFAKPTEPQIKRLQNTAGRDASQASRNLLLSTIHPDDKDALLRTIAEYPGILASYAGVLVKSVGITADLGN